MMKFPKSMEKEVRDFYQDGQRLLTMMILIGKSQKNGNDNIFYRRKVELSPDMNKIKKR